MDAIKNSNFPFITILSARIGDNTGSMEMSNINMVAVWDNGSDIDVHDCVNLVYHINADTAREYQKQLEVDYNNSPEGIAMQKVIDDKKLHFKAKLAKFRRIKELATA